MARGDIYQRGTVILNRGQTRRLVRKERATMSAAVLHGPNAVLSIAGVPLTMTDETQHCKFVGITGSGKTTAISSLIEGALARGDRAIIADPDGVYSKRFYDPDRGDIIFNPFDARSAKWDIFSEIKDDYDIEDLARSLIPDLPDSHEAEWRGYARTFFTDVTQRLWKSEEYEPQARTTQELHRLLTRASVAELREMLKDTASQAFLHHDAAKMFAGIQAVTSSAVRAFKYIGRQEGDALSVREWVKQGEPGQGGVLFLPYRAGEIEALKSTISAWMRLGIFEAMNREEGDQRLWFVVDELGALGRIGGLSDGLTRLRKFGGRVVLGFQSIDQVQALYGKSDANTIVENCGNTLLLRCGTADQGGTSKFASQLVGEREMKRTLVSKSYKGFTDIFGTTTKSPQFHTEHAVMPAEIEQLPNHTGYLRLSSRPEWMQVAVGKPTDKPRRSLFARLWTMLKRVTSSFLGRAPPQRQSKMSFNPASTSSSQSIAEVTSMENSLESSNTAAAEPTAASAAEAGSAAPAAELESPASTVPTDTAAEAPVEHGEITQVIRPSANAEIHKYADGTRAFERFGTTLNTPHENPDMVRTLVQEARDLSWKQIRVNGSESFRSQVWEQASSQGMRVHGYRPSPAQRAALAEKLGAARSADSKHTDNSISRANIFDRAKSFAGALSERGRQLGAKLVNALTKRSAGKARFSEAREAEPFFERDDNTISRKRSSLWGRLLSWGRRLLASAERNAADDFNSIEVAEPYVRHVERLHRQEAGRDPKASKHIDRSTIPEDAIKGKFVRRGNTSIYCHSGSRAEAFRDGGAKLSTRGDDRNIIESLVRIAEARQWKKIMLKGSEEFRREAWLQATPRGIVTYGFKPREADWAELTRRHNADRDKDAQERSNAPAPQQPAPQQHKTADTSAATQADQTDSKSKNAAERPKPRKFTDDEKRRLVAEYTQLQNDRPGQNKFMSREGVGRNQMDSWAYRLQQEEKNRETSQPALQGNAAGQSSPTANSTTAAEQAPATAPQRPILSHNAQAAAKEARSSIQDYHSADYVEVRDASPQGTAQTARAASTSASRGGGMERVA